MRNLLPPDLPAVLGAEIPMERVLINLIANAVDAYGQVPRTAAGIIDVSGAAEGGHVVLRVSDQAGGVPEAALHRVFEPFFTTKLAGKGTGLGLSLCFGTIIGRGGHIGVRNENGGAVFEIHMPAAAEAQRTAV